MRSKLFVILLALIFAATLATVAWSEYGDVVLDKHKETMDEVGLAPVVFPHWFHRIKFKCKACHEDIFIMEKGANDITMSAIIKGEYCGTCHNGKIAWDPLYCDRCHSYETETQETVGND